jgi:hypothetical protein
MDLSNMHIFKYLQNHPTYKIFCRDEILRKLVNENNRLEYQPHYLTICNNDIYIEIVHQSIFMNIWITSTLWENNELGFWCYVLDKNKTQYGISLLIKLKQYPIFSEKFIYDLKSYKHNQETIIEILEKLQILNSVYRNKQFQNITLKCVQAIICIQNVLCHDLVNLIIELLLKLMPHGEDFVWHCQQLKIEQNNCIQLLLY